MNNYVKRALRSLMHSPAQTIGELHLHIGCGQSDFEQTVQWLILNNVIEGAYNEEQLRVMSLTEKGIDLYATCCE